MSEVLPSCWWFGCWLEPGHFLVAPDQSLVRDECPFYRCDWMLDGGYAPRLRKPGYSMPVPVHDDGIVFSMLGKSREDRQRITYNSDELPQGRFLRHEVNDCTLISWWDRTQGDTRGACNSTFIVAGAHHVNEMLHWLPEALPLQIKRLADARISLVCVNQGMR